MTLELYIQMWASLLKIWWPVVVVATFLLVVLAIDEKKEVSKCTK